MDWNRRFFWLLASVTVLRFAYLFIAPLDLAPDEAYYWDWSRHLDWGYYSKPPLIAWIIALASRTMGNSAAFVRVPSVFLGTVSALALFLLARRMFDARTGFWAAVAAMASPGGSVAAFVMTIDAPLLCFWSLSLYLLWKALEKEKGGTALWVGLAVTMGFGLLAKQVMGGFMAAMFLFLIVSAKDRRFLKSPAPWLCSLLALAALAPPLLWNARHGWITLHHTAGHFEGARSFFLATLGEFIGSQIGVISPVTWVLLIILSVVLVLRAKSLDRREMFLLCFSFVPLSAVFLLSLRQRIEPNWPAAFYPAGMVLLAAWGCGAFSTGSGLDAKRSWFRKGVIVGVVMALLVYALPFWAASAPGPWMERLVARLQGWHTAGLEAGKAFREVPSPDKTVVLTFNRQLASELAFYMPGRPAVYNWRSPGADIENQYDIWGGPPAGSDALLVVPESDSWIPKAVAGWFQDMKRIDLPAPSSGLERYGFYLGTGLKKWPHPAEQK